MSKRSGKRKAKRAGASPAARPAAPSSAAATDHDGEDDAPEAPHVDAPRNDAQRGDAPRSDGSGGDAQHGDAQRSDGSGGDAQRGDASGGHAQRGERDSAGASISAQSNRDDNDAPRGDAHRGDATRGDAPRSDADAAQRDVGAPISSRSDHGATDASSSRRDEPDAATSAQSNRGATKGAAANRNRDDASNRDDAAQPSGRSDRGATDASSSTRDEPDAAISAQSNRGTTEAAAANRNDASNRADANRDDAKRDANRDDAKRDANRGDAKRDAGPPILALSNRGTTKGAAARRVDASKRTDANRDDAKRDANRDDAKRDARRDAKRGAKRPREATPSKPAPRPRGFGEAWNAFFFADRDVRLASVIRIGYAVLLLVNLVCLAPDLQLWFSDDGLMPAATGEGIINEHALTLFSYLPHEPWVLWGAYGLLVTHAVLLLLGWHTRIQAIGVFIWLTSFQHRNYAIVDGEDTVFRMFAFYLALCPAGWAFSLDARRRKPEATPPAPWALRLFQIQISVIYLSSAIEKSLGTHWPSGRALYYIARLDDAFGKWPMPAFPFESLALIKVMSWAVLLLEWTLPIFLWIKRTRTVALVVAIAFHLAIDYTMNLFLFHWIMILGLLAFAEYDQLARLRFWRRRD